MLLYHVSLRQCRKSIAISGVDPLWSKGRERLSWWVDRSRLMWAVAHCSARHGVSVQRLDVWAYCSSDGLPGARSTRYKGIYSTPCRVVPGGVYEAQFFIDMEEKLNEAANT